MKEQDIPVKIMGILNVTPDSFSDGGCFADLDTAVAQADQLIRDGADIIDVGGESTRPFATPVAEEEELERVIPVIKAVRDRYPLIPLSIDTTKAVVAQAALTAGASIINDISALRHDPKMIVVARECDVPLIIMHMQKTPADMQIKPVYNNVVEDVISFLAERIAWLTENGIKENRLIVDPGIGFGKTLEHNIDLLKNLGRLASLHVPILLGHSRKRFLGDLTGINDEKERDLATAVVAALCINKNIAMVRVHDVSATRQALLLAQALRPE